MTDYSAIPGPNWIAPFLGFLAAGSTVTDAMRAVNRTRRAVYTQRKRNAAFAAAWLKCRPPTVYPPAVAEPPLSSGRAVTGSGSKHFLEVLAETSSVSVSARRANVSIAHVYRLRRKSADFSAGWRAALAEGYDMLEMELLGHLRDPSSQRKMDVTSALRLLAAHRDTVARERALREDDDEEAVLESIDRFIGEMRDRREANAALLLEHSPAANDDEVETATESNDATGGEDDATG